MWWRGGYAALTALVMPTEAAQQEMVPLLRAGLRWEELPCGSLFKMLFSKGCLFAVEYSNSGFHFQRRAKLFLLLSWPSRTRQTPLHSGGIHSMSHALKEGCFLISQCSGDHKVS